MTVVGLTKQGKTIDKTGSFKFTFTFSSIFSVKSADVLFYTRLQSRSVVETLKAMHVPTYLGLTGLDICVYLFLLLIY